MASEYWGTCAGVSIREVENGYIITANYKEYVFSSLKAALKEIEKHYNGAANA